MDEFMPPWASLLTFTGLAGLVVLSVMRGWLVPGRTVDKLIEQKDRALNDRDAIIRELRAALVATDQRNDLLANQIHRLIASGYASPPAPIQAIVATQAIEAGDTSGGRAGVRDPGSQAEAPPRGSQAGRYPKARRRGKQGR